MYILGYGDVWCVCVCVGGNVCDLALREMTEGEREEERDDVCVRGHTYTHTHIRGDWNE